MALPCDLPANRVLAALPVDERARLQPHFESIDLRLGQVLCEPEVMQRHVYFPTRAVVSLSYLTAGGAPAEIAVVGNDGFVGSGRLFGGGSTTSRGEVQVAGPGFRISALALRGAFDRSASVRRLLLYCMQALMTQVAQAAVCNRFHTLEQRLCRLLLQRLDLLQGGAFVVTQELVACALGVRREGVNEAAHRLHAVGLICCTRGHIVVLDRARLAQRSCECYAVVRKECDRLFGLASNGALPRPIAGQVAASAGVGRAEREASRVASSAWLDHV